MPCHSQRRAGWLAGAGVVSLCRGVAGVFHCASGNYDNRLEFSDHLFRDKYGDRMHSYFCKSVKKRPFHTYPKTDPARRDQSSWFSFSWIWDWLFYVAFITKFGYIASIFLATIDRSVDGPGDLRRYELPCIISFSATPSSLRMIMMP